MLDWFKASGRKDGLFAYCRMPHRSISRPPLLSRPLSGVFCRMGSPLLGEVVVLFDNERGKDDPGTSESSKRFAASEIRNS